MEYAWMFASGPRDREFEPALDNRRVEQRRFPRVDEKVDVFQPGEGTVQPPVALPMAVADAVSLQTVEEAPNDQFFRQVVGCVQQPDKTLRPIGAFDGIFLQQIGISNSFHRTSPPVATDRKSVVWGKSVSVLV